MTLQKRLPETAIHDVSDTSFWVAHYRALETDRSDALFRDSLAKKLVGERGKIISDSMGKMSRYTAWSVVSRTVIIDRFISELITQGVDAIVNLGAGLDTRPYRMNLPANLEWVEIDHTNIIDHKNKTLNSETPKCKLTRIAVDLADGEKRKAVLSAIVPTAKKVLILTEGVIPYLSPEQVTDLSKDLIAEKRFTYWITEYFSPKVYPYLKRTVRTQKLRNAPFKFYPDDWFGFFKKIGWKEKQTRFAGEIAQEFKRRPPMPILFALILPLLSKKIKEQFIKMSGYVVLERN